jgi:predicted dehydrogenase
VNSWTHSAVLWRAAAGPRQRVNAVDTRHPLGYCGPPEQSHPLTFAMMTGVSHTALVDEDAVGSGSSSAALLKATDPSRRHQKRVGVIGCGFIATEQHLSALAGTAGVTISAACDLDRDRLTNYAARAGLAPDQLYDDVGRMLDTADLDCVVIATPPASHASLAAQALRAGKHVFCEKPMAQTLSEAREMASAAAASGRALGVMCNFLHFPEIVELRRLIADLEPQRPRTISLRGLGLGADVEMIERYLRDPDTAVSGNARGGIILDYAVHAIYVCNACLGSSPHTVTCRTESSASGVESVESSATCLLEYEETRVVLDLSWEPRTPTPERYLQRGELCVAYDDRLIEMSYAGNGEGLHAPALGVIVTTAEGEAVIPIAPATPSGKLRASFARAFAGFFMCSVPQATLDPTGELALGAMAVIDACLTSAITQRAVEHAR